MKLRPKTIGYAILGALLVIELIFLARVGLLNRAASRATPLATPRAVAAARLSTTAPSARLPHAQPAKIKLGAEAFWRQGQWELARHFGDGRLNGESVRSFHAGSSATLAFVGRAVRLYGIVGRGGGLAKVEVDGRFVRNVSFYARKKGVHKVVFSSARLVPGVHRLKVSVIYETAGKTVRSRYVNIDGAEIVN